MYPAAVVRNGTSQELAGAQRMRLRHALLAIGAAAALSAVVVVLSIRGALRLDAPGLALAMALFWAVNLAFPAAIVSGLNLRLRDPGMTLAQMLWATLATFAFVYVTDEGRHLVLMVYLLAMMFGAFRLKVGEHLLVTLVAVVLYALVIAALSRTHPASIDVRDEVLDWLVFCVVMAGFSLLGAGTSRLRAALQRRDAELAQARDAAAVATEAESRFLATTSHELRTPLNTILGATEVIDGQRLEDEQRAALAGARHAGAHLLSLLNAMIDYSKLESGTLELRHAPMDLGETLKTVHAMFAPLAQERGISFALEVDPRVARTVQGDAMRLAEVLVHLLHNAVRFTERGEVRLAAGPEPAGGDRVRFCVSDTGAGIPRERQQALLAPFATGDARGGAGLGLALCRSLVERMGGTLQVSSTPGAGNRFEFALPLPPVAAQRGAAPSASARRVLIVDDSPDNRLLLRAFLKGAASVLDEAADGREGVALFRERRYDVVLMDMHMPQMDGIEATRAMRALERERGGPRTPILALTADDSVHDRQRSLEAGCDEHLVKPVSKRALLAALAGQ